MGKQTGGSSEAMPPTSVSQLLAIESVRALKARYFRLMDMKLWDQWQALFAADAVMDVRGEGSALAALGFPEPDPSSLLWTGAGRIREAVSTALEGVATVHHGQMGEFTFRGKGCIEAIWAMEDRIRYPAGASAPIAGFNGYGHYHDTYVRAGDEWGIARVELRRLMVEPVGWPNGSGRDR